MVKPGYPNWNTRLQEKWNWAKGYAATASDWSITHTISIVIGSFTVICCCCSMLLLDFDRVGIHDLCVFFFFAFFVGSDFFTYANKCGTHVRFISLDWFETKTTALFFVYPSITLAKRFWNWLYRYHFVNVSQLCVPTDVKLGFHLFRLPLFNYFDSDRNYLSNTWKRIERVREWERERTTIKISFKLQKLFFGIIKCEPLEQSQ